MPIPIFQIRGWRVCFIFYEGERHAPISFSVDLFHIGTELGNLD